MLTELMGGELTARSTPGVGSTFCVRLFLPQAAGSSIAEHAAGPGIGPLAPPAAARTGYEGTRRRILVVDNEEADRALMQDLLQPLGFEIHSVASGAAALARLADPHAPRPDAVFMDLAMPGIDGWETIRRLRAAGHAALPLAVVSANAFDRALDNDAGVVPADFLVKPVRLPLLLDWLGRRLALVWITTAVPPADAHAAPTDPGAERLPDEVQLDALRSLLDLGYLRGVQRKLDEIEHGDAAAARFVARLRGLAQRFEIDALQAAVAQALGDRRQQGEEAHAQRPDAG
jgi:CheY-like chemotaxis protein